MYLAFRTLSGRSTQLEHKNSLSLSERPFAIAQRHLACERSKDEVDDADVHRVPELLLGRSLIHGGLRHGFVRDVL